MIRWRNRPISCVNAAETSGSSRPKGPFKVEFTSAYVAISVTKPRGKREDCNITQGFSFFAEGRCTEEPRRFRD